MTEFITEHGEIIDDDPTAGLTPYQLACRQLVAFKLKTIETVAADPRLKEGACTEAMVVYLSFLTVDKETLKPKPVYASAIKLMARGKMRSKTTAKKARQLLADFGYLVPVGSATKDGCIWYHVANPNVERVAMHVHEAEERYTELDAERRREDRRKQKAKVCVVPENDPTQTSRGNNGWPHVAPENDPKYLRINLGYSLSEGRDDLHRDTARSPYAAAHGGDEENQPLPKPRDEVEAGRMIEAMCEGFEVNRHTRDVLCRLLNKGILTPNMAKNIITPEKEAAGEAA